MHSCVVSHFSCIQLFVTRWALVCQAPLSMGILQARTLEWAAMSSPPGDLLNSGIEPVSPAAPELQMGSSLLNH